MFDAAFKPVGPSGPAEFAPQGAYADAAPRGRGMSPELSDDKSYDEEGDLSCVAARVEERIDELEREIASIAPLVKERARLLRARALLRGDPAPGTGERSGPRITREDVFDYLTRNPGSGPGEIAAGLRTGQGAVSAHLYRGKGRLFSTRDGRWYPVPKLQR